MLLAQIEGFVEIARQGNMGRAAQALSISQPALSARLQALEEELGAGLFRRTHAGMVLTPAGRAFLPHADRAIEAIRSGGSLVRQLEHGVVGELALAVAPAVSAYVLPEILVRFTERHPNVRLLVRTGHSEEIVDLVARGEVELGIVRQLRDARVRSRPLYEDELILVARPDHPFAIAGTVDVSEISHAQLILFDRTSSYYDVTNALFRIAGVVPRGVTEVDNIEAAKRMVERGLGVALLPGTAIADSLSGGLLREIELAGTGTIRRRIVAVERLGARPASPFLDDPVGTPRADPGAHPAGAADRRRRLSRCANRAKQIHRRADLIQPRGCRQDPRPGRGNTAASRDHSHLEQFELGRSSQRRDVATGRTHRHRPTDQVVVAEGALESAPTAEFHIERLGLQRGVGHPAALGEHPERLPQRGLSDARGVPHANELDRPPGRATLAFADELGDQRHLMHGGDPRQIRSRAWWHGPR